MLGLLSKSVKGIDRDLLYQAIQQLLKNPDGRTRGTVESLYKSLSFKELQPLMPAIIKAIKEPSPSGVMFSSQIRLGGLALLAKYHIEEGMPLCFDTMEIYKWGKKSRVSKCLKILASYGSEAKTMIPRLQQLEQDLMLYKESKTLTPLIQEVKDTIKSIQQSKKKITLRTLEDK